MTSGVVTSVANVCVTGLGYPIYLHYLGYEKYGVWLVISIVLSFVQLSNLGVGTAVMKLVAEEYESQNISAIREYVLNGIVIVVAGGFVAVVAVLLFRNTILQSFGLTGQNVLLATTLLPYLAVLSVYAFVVQLLGATLSGCGRIDICNATDSVGRVIALIAAASLLAHGTGIVSLLIANCCLYAFQSVVYVSQINRIIRVWFPAAGRVRLRVVRKLLNFGGGIMGGALVNMLLGPLNKLVLLRYAGVATVPVYEIAYSGAMQLRSLIEAGFRAVAPEISRLTAISTRSSLSRISGIYAKSMKMVFLLGLPLWIILLVCSRPLLQLWLRDRYVPELTPAFQVMLVGTFFSMVGVPAFYFLLGIGRTRDLFLCNVVMSSTNAAFIVVALLFTAKLSLNHVVVAVGMGMTCSTLYLLWQQQRAFARYSTMVSQG